MTFLITILPNIKSEQTWRLSLVFQVYVKYCSQQVYQDRTLAKLRAGSPAFTEALRELESSPACQSLAMHSFLMLPMQVLLPNPYSCILYRPIFSGSLGCPC